MRAPQPIISAPAAGLMLCVLALAACGAPEPAGESASAPGSETASVSAPAPVAAGEEDDPDADALFAAACADQGADPAVCACMRKRVVAASGMRGLAYVGAAFGPDPAQAAPYEAAMDQVARDIAAEAYLDAQFECIAGADPGFTPPAPPVDGAALAESPLEQAVAACVDHGVADEPLCRCRVEAAFDTLGEDGLALAEADARGDRAAVEALARDHGAQWLNDGLGALAAARTPCL